MKKRSKRHLELHRDTVRRLTEEALRGAEGGRMATSDGTCVRNCAITWSGCQTGCG